MTNQPPDKALERICDAIWHGESLDGVTLLDIYRHDAINCTASGTIEVDGVMYGFIIDDGDFNGTVVRAWGDPEDVGLYHPPKRDRFIFVPKNLYLKVSTKAYLQMRDQKSFKEQEGKMNYDFRFAPGVVTKRYYRDWAEQHGLRIDYLSNQEPFLREAIEKEV